jgi:hypothetical protein
MSSLFRFELLSEVYVDACLRDDSGKLLFMSCFGRDTSMQQMFAAFTLPPSSGGLATFNLRGSDNRRHAVDVGDADRLGKHTGRLSSSLFGQLVHTWVFDKQLQELDHANRTAWLLDRRTVLTGACVDTRIWDICKALSPVPLLDHWQIPLLDAIREDSITAFDQTAIYPPLGDIVAYRIHLQDSFLERVSAMVKSHVLTLTINPATERLAA